MICPKCKEKIDTCVLFGQASQTLYLNDKDCIEEYDDIEFDEEGKIFHADNNCMYDISDLVK